MVPKKRKIEQARRGDSVLLKYVDKPKSHKFSSALSKLGSIMKKTR